MYFIKNIKGKFCVCEMPDGARGAIRSVVSRHDKRADALSHIELYEWEDREDDGRIRQAMGWR